MPGRQRFRSAIAAAAAQARVAALAASPRPASAPARRRRPRGRTRVLVYSTQCSRAAAVPAVAPRRRSQGVHVDENWYERRRPAVRPAGMTPSSRMHARRGLTRASACRRAASTTTRSRSTPAPSSRARRWIGTAKRPLVVASNNLYHDAATTRSSPRWRSPALTSRQASRWSVSAASQVRQFPHRDRRALRTASRAPTTSGTAHPAADRVGRRRAAARPCVQPGARRHGLQALTGSSARWKGRFPGARVHGYWTGVRRCRRRRVHLVATPAYQEPAVHEDDHRVHLRRASAALSWRRRACSRARSRSVARRSPARWPTSAGHPWVDDDKVGPIDRPAA